MDDLGPTGPWHVRGVPERVKQYFADRAHAERCSVAELLTRIAMQDQVPDAPVDASPDASGNPVDADRLLKALQALKLASELPDDPPKGLRGATSTAKALVRAELTALRGDRRRPALPAPEAADTSPNASTG